MAEPAQHVPEGRRARKRRVTENAIETAAVDLALQLGVERVSVEAICELADVSRSTFFNYFAARDHAIVGRAVEVPQGEAAFAVLDTCPDDLARGMFRLVFAGIGHAHVNTDVARKRAVLMAQQPAAARMTSVVRLETGAGLIAAAEAWLRLHPERSRLGDPAREAVLARAVVTGVIEAMLLDAAEQKGDPVVDDETFDRAAAELRTLIDAGRGAPRA